jgi:hypothetical protein
MRCAVRRYDAVAIVDAHAVVTQGWPNKSVSRPPLMQNDFRPARVPVLYWAVKGDIDQLAAR